jgi:hypothetical protein
MTNKKEPRKFWTIFDTQLKTIFHQYTDKHKADLALKELIARGFKKGVFEIVPTQEVLLKKKAKRYLKLLRFLIIFYKLKIKNLLI